MTSEYKMPVSYHPCGHSVMMSIDNNLIKDQIEKIECGEQKEIPVLSSSYCEQCFEERIYTDDVEDPF